MLQTLAPVRPKAMKLLGVPLPRRRLCYTAGFLVCAGLLAFALYLQFQLHEDPCPLCIFQRVAVAVLGAAFLLAALHNPGRIGAVLYGLLQCAVATIGAGIAARHVWIQHLPPDKVPDCGPGLGYMLESFPLGQTLRMVLQGSGECAAKGWQFLGMTIPEWTLLFFVAMGIGALAQLWNRR